MTSGTKGTDVQLLTNSRAKQHSPHAGQTKEASTPRNAPTTLDQAAFADSVEPVSEQVGLCKAATSLTQHPLVDISGIHNLSHHMLVGKQAQIGVPGARIFLRRLHTL